MKTKMWWELDSPEGMKWLRDEQKVNVVHHLDTLFSGCKEKTLEI